MEFKSTVMVLQNKLVCIQYRSHE